MTIRHNSSSNMIMILMIDNDRLSVTYRHYIRNRLAQKNLDKCNNENMELKQQLELMKMCGRVNS